MEECACLCGLGSSRGCRCPQKRQRPAETAKAEGERCPQKRQRPAETAKAEGERCPQKRQRPAETAKAEGQRCPQKRQRPAETAKAEGERCPQKRQRPAETTAAEVQPAPAEKHLEADTAACCWAGSGGIASPRPPPHCSLQDLPMEMLVEIFSSLPGSDLASLAQVCTKFHRILHMDSIWIRRCWVEFGVRENLQNLQTVGTSYREVYAKLLHPYRHILGLWQLDTKGFKTLLYVAVDGLRITGWTHVPCLTHVDGAMQFKPELRIRLTETNSATVECMEGRHRRPHSSHLHIHKDRLTSQCKKTDHRGDSPTRLWEEFGTMLFLQYEHLDYRRLYLQPSHPDHLIRPGLFQGKYPRVGLMIFMLSFHGKYARVTGIQGALLQTLEIHLRRRIQLRDGEIFRDLNQLCRVVQELDDQVLREQQQQQEDGTEESEGHGWQSPAQPSVGESGAAPAEEQPVPFVLPEGVRSTHQNYPGTCRMCFYGVETGTAESSFWHFPGVVILFDENHLGFIDLDDKSFILYGRVQNTFHNVEAPSPQAFLEMRKNIQQVSHHGFFLNPHPRIFDV